MRLLDIFLLAIMSSLFLFSFAILWQNFPRQSVDYESYIANLTVDAKAVSVAQFYPNMRYKSSTISYSIEEACNQEKTQSIHAALTSLEDKTILSFVEKEDGEIKYLCSKESPSSEYGDHYVAGEGGPTGIINTTLFSVILSGQVSLYRAERCEEPQIALHETLHALGFDHVSNKSDIMYPITECEQEINEEMINSINELYSIRGSPDLGIEFVQANQTGKFLNFYITISNYGLRDSDGASLEILGDNEPIREFELGKIRLGTKKFLNVQNMRIDDSDVKVVRFQINTNEDDLNDKNDFAELYLKG